MNLKMGKNATLTEVDGALNLSRKENEEIS